MKEARTDSNNFLDRVRRSLGNTLNFENHSEFTDYDYEQTTSKVGSALSLMYADNYILDKVVPFLKTDAELRTFTEDDLLKYNGKPMSLSKDIYGSIDYWWIILAVNGYFNPSDFHSFTQLAIPTKSSIENILDRELYTNSKIGVLE